MNRNFTFQQVERIGTPKTLNVNIFTQILSNIRNVRLNSFAGHSRRKQRSFKCFLIVEIMNVEEKCPKIYPSKGLLCDLIAENTETLLKILIRKVWKN